MFATLFALDCMNMTSMANSRLNSNCFSAWTNRRSMLHHDWLQNSYRNFISARIEYLNDVLVLKQSARVDILDQLFEWEDKKVELIELIDATVEALSPRQLVDEHPLNVMPEESKTWLKEILHALYLERTHIEDTVASIRNMFDAVCAMHTKLMCLLNGENGALRVELGDAPFTKFRDMVQEFSKMISALPHEVQVI